MPNAWYDRIPNGTEWHGFTGFNQLALMKKYSLLPDDLQLEVVPHYKITLFDDKGELQTVREGRADIAAGPWGMLLRRTKVCTVH